MLTFDTPGPIAATLDVVVGDVRISAATAPTPSSRVRAERRVNEEDARPQSRRASSSPATSSCQGPEAALVAAARAPAAR